MSQAIERKLRLKIFKLNICVISLERNISDTELGAVLTRNIDNNNHMIAFATRSFSEAERKYSTLEKECLAVE